MYNQVTHPSYRAMADRTRYYLSALEAAKATTGKLEVFIGQSWSELTNKEYELLEQGLDIDVLARKGEDIILAEIQMNNFGG